MDLSIRYVLELRDIAGVKQEHITLNDGSNVEDLLGHLLKRYPGMKPILCNMKTGALQARVKVLVNGRDSRFINGMQTKLATSDVISILPALR
jgi:MoaD family protein